MPVTSLSVDNELLSTTAIMAAEEAKDALHINTPLIEAQERVHSKGFPNKSGGVKWIQGIGTGDHSKNTRMRTGYEAIDLSVTGVATPVVVTPAKVVRPVLISGEEEELNGGEEQIIDIVAMRTKQTIGGLKRDFCKQIIQGSVTGFEDWGTLNGVDETTAGLLEEAAFGSQDSTYGGFSKSTHSSIPGAQNVRYDIGGSFNSAGLTGLNRVLIETEKYADDDLLKSRVVLASTSGMENLKRSLQAYERYTNADTLDGTNLKLHVGGVPVAVEHYMPTSGTNTTADPISFYVIDFSNIYVCWSKGIQDGYFGMSEFREVGGDYDVRRALITVRGQLWVRKWSTSAILFDGETF
tara:strand:- start:190 stop:1248 length:1059 start_codon:yes stop_codon:yes gene_type:complete